MTKTKTFIVLSVALLGSGCNLFGPILTETFHEQKIPAEFDLADNADAGVLVYIDESKAGGTYQGFKAELAEAINKRLIKKVRLDKKNIKWQPDNTFSASKDVAIFSPAQAGREAGASLVLYIWIQEFNLYDIDGRGFFEGSLVSRSALVDAATEEIIWPADKQPRRVRAKVDIETEGKDIATAKLISTTAHCICRNFYNCPRDQYQASHEEKSYQMEDW